MADKYVIQIAKEGGAKSCDKFKNLYIEDIKDIVQTNFKIDKIEDINDSNYSTIIKSINEHLNDEKYKNFKKLSENDKKIIIKDVGIHSKNEIFLFSCNSYYEKVLKELNNLLLDAFKEIENKFKICGINSHCNKEIEELKNEKLEEKIKEIIENFINQNLNSNFIVWKEFCHIEGASQDNVPCKINDKRNDERDDMNRLFITNENFDKNTDILCFMNININAKDGEHIIDIFKYEEVHLCKDNY